MGVLGSILGNAVNSAFSGLNAQTSYHYNLKLQKAINTNRHQWEVSDLRKAGLNPILSATNGMGFANAGSVSVAASDQGLGSSETSSNSAIKVTKLNNDNSQVIADKQNKTSKDIADQSNATQKDFNDKQVVIGMMNADSNRISAESNAAFQKANTEATLRSIDRADAVAAADIAMKNNIGYGALLTGEAANRTSNTGYARMLKQNEVDDEIKRGHKIHNDWDENHPYSSNGSAGLQFFNWASDQASKYSGYFPKR